MDGVAWATTTHIPAFVTLVHILSTVAADPWVSRDRGTTAWALQGLRGGLIVFIEVCKLNHQVGGHDGQGQVNLHLCLPRGQLNLFGLMPASWPRKETMPAREGRSVTFSDDILIRQRERLSLHILLRQ